jgi:histidine triad (HIT) family protein
MGNCIFCKIINREIESKIVYETEKILAFNDTSPAAPQHVLVVPKPHIASLNEINDENSSYVTEIFKNIPKIAKKLGFSDYRIVNNCGESAGQTVMHLHFHLLCGRNFDWPPG